MSDYALGRCVSCDRLIMSAEGKIAAYLYDRMEKCEKCIELEQTKDFNELAELEGSLYEHHS